ncbi:SDR family NAD(P)-dependent oxidoreductase [Elioraea rosea]|uniref:SDR family NAD(P)-dependent oxidoreductase n=1 Tax=Elioraea rosea TaxID=2492390 RepID=UPI001181F7C8|nr:SDR family oxidoreductase [Elioraea rosea]
MTHAGKTAVVTGGASGIGLATVERLARLGVTVALNHLPDDPAGPEQAARLRAEGFAVLSAPGDVSDAASIETMMAEALRRLGRLDILVNNAGTPATKAPIAPAELEAMTDAFWDRIIATNLLGPFRCTSAAAPALRQAKGAVVNTASIAGFTALGSSIAYGASKAGLINMTVNLARALAPECRVNAVAPGAVDTPWQKDWPESRRKAAAEKALLKRRCTADDIAEAIVFLATTGSPITGQTLVVDAGLTLAP